MVTALTYSINKHITQLLALVSESVSRCSYGTTSLIETEIMCDDLFLQISKLELEASQLLSFGEDSTFKLNTDIDLHYKKCKLGHVFSKKYYN